MIKIANQTHYYKQQARKLVESVRDFPVDRPFVLSINDEQLELCCDINSQTTCFVHSFTSQKLIQRSLQKNQTLLKACNNKKRDIKTVVDLTAGWGRDSFILATHGQQVCMVEQNDLIYYCLDYLLEIAREDKTNELFNRLHLEQNNSFNYLSNLQGIKPDCLYLDPMFPAHKSGARPSKDLQILQLVTENQDMIRVFELALQKAQYRVVVKRPIHSPALNELKPDIVYREKTIRFDVYLCTNH
jgi:16S rRNA (guanine1516-N2)-methyltransferase